MALAIFNIQYSILNECGDSQCINALNHYFIDHSLIIDHCPLIHCCSEGGV